MGAWIEIPNQSPYSSCASSHFGMSYVHLFTFEKKKSFMGSSELLIADPASDPVWVNCPDNTNLNPKMKEQIDGQIENYREFIKGRKVLPTFEETIAFLNTMNQRIIFKENE